MSIPYDVGPESFPSGKPFRNVFNRNRTEPCDHHWQRLPIVDLSVIYQCRECETALQISWIAAAAGTLDDLDRAFEARYGGKVCQGT